MYNLTLNDQKIKYEQKRQEYRDHILKMILDLIRRGGLLRFVKERQLEAEDHGMRVLTEDES